MRIHRDLDAAPEPPVLDMRLFERLAGPHAFQGLWIYVEGRCPYAYFDLTGLPLEGERTVVIEFGPNGLFSFT